MAYEICQRCGLETIGPTTDGAFDDYCVCSHPLIVVPEPALCDCERGHNGLGMAARLCDCGRERGSP